MTKKEPDKNVQPPGDTRTFDQWYADSHMGFSFDAHYMLPHHSKDEMIKALSREVRKYVSEVKPDLDK